MAYHFLALFFAALLPAMLFVSQAAVRKQRGAVYLDVVRSLFPDDRLPQVELIGAKYGAAGQAGGVWSNRRQPAALLLAALLYLALTFVGFELLLVPIAALVDLGDVAPPDWTLVITPSFLWSSGGADNAALKNTVAVAAVAFLGGYIGAAGFLVRQALNYELDGMSFMRSSLQVIMGMVIALVAFRALTVGGDHFSRMLNLPTAVHQPQVTPVAKPVPPGEHATKTENCGPEGCEHPAGWWLGVGFLLGLSPETGLAWLSRRMRLSLQKNANLDFFDKVQIVPVEVVDGIDSQIAYRLDQNNIEDIQNLATANPVQLFIETPYGLFEVFDWILQAQLCLVSGPDVFLELKRHGIRTIFDLERAVLAKGAPDAYVEAIGEVLFAGAGSAFRVRVGGSDKPINAEIIRHAVAVALDDLHVRRLRVLWLEIKDKSWPTKDGRRKEWLQETSPLPGEPDYLKPV